jgi:hypothetical protein
LDCNEKKLSNKHTQLWWFQSGARSDKKMQRGAPINLEVKLF